MLLTTKPEKVEGGYGVAFTQHGGFAVFAKGTARQARGLALGYYLAAPSGAGGANFTLQRAAGSRLSLFLAPWPAATAFLR
jgi:hypothetical protein